MDTGINQRHRERISTIGDSPGPTWTNQECDLGLHYQIGEMGRPRQIESDLQVDSKVKHQLTGYLFKITHIPHLQVFIWIWFSYCVAKYQSRGLSLCQSKFLGSNGMPRDYDARLLVMITFITTFVIICMYLSLYTFTSGTGLIASGVSIALIYTPMKIKPR